MSFIRIVANDGQSLTINRYFLQLYNKFYWSLLHDLTEDVAIIQQEITSLKDLKKFVEKVNEKLESGLAEAEPTSDLPSPLMIKQELIEEVQESPLKVTHTIADKKIDMTKILGARMDKINREKRAKKKEKVQKKKNPKICPEKEMILSPVKLADDKTKSNFITDNMKIDEEESQDRDLSAHIDENQEEDLQEKRVENKESSKKTRIYLKRSNTISNVKVTNKVGLKRPKKKWKSKAKSQEAIERTNAKLLASSDEVKEYFNGDSIVCPFHCPEEEMWNNDLAFAHICINHQEEIKTLYKVPWMQLVKLLETKLTSLKCAILDCKQKQRVTNNLSVHYKQVHVIDPRICDHCGVTFQHLAALKSHEKRVEESKIVKDFVCADCGKISENLMAYKFHKARHIEKFLNCDQCTYVTKGGNVKLLEHINSIHKGYKPFACDMCDVKMAKMTNLSDHRMKVHKQTEKLTVAFYKSLIAEGKHPYLTEYVDHYTITSIR